MSILVFDVGQTKRAELHLHLVEPYWICPGLTLMSVLRELEKGMWKDLKGTLLVWVANYTELQWGKKVFS